MIYVKYEEGKSLLALVCLTQGMKAVRGELG